MNYIKLLNSAFEKFYQDERPNPTHISLYMALFQEWNRSRFAEDFYVNRRELMHMSKIGSKTTYHRCIVNLHYWEYLAYFPSNNPFKGSKIKMAILGTSDEPITEQYNPILEQLAEQYRPKYVPFEGHHHPKYEQAIYPYRPINGQAVVPYINNNKQENINKQPNNWLAVINFFDKKGFDADEGKKFFEHYDERQWLTSDGEPIRDWRALAINWMDRNELLNDENKSKTNQPSQIRDNLRTTKSKDYGQPL